jgi:23S rRNA pseudouridine2604 synthase
MGQKVAGTEDIRLLKQSVPANKPTAVYLAYNKPVGIICSTDPRARDNIVNAVNYPERIFNIGRLDVASSGLILLTNDGDIVNKILRAEGRHEKEYWVKVDKTITPEFLRTMQTGIMLDGRKTLPAKLKQLSDLSFTITLTEGRNRQIRRMCEALGYTVKSLHRIRIMHIKLGDLKDGEWRPLTPAETTKLLKQVS